MEPQRGSDRGPEGLDPISAHRSRDDPRVVRFDRRRSEEATSMAEMRAVRLYYQHWPTDRMSA